MKIMDEKTFFEDLYRDFNARDIEKVLSRMHDDVKWANGMEGGFVNGRDAVREYWTRQFAMINSQVNPLKIEGAADKTALTVHQLIKDLDGKVLQDTTVTHVYRFENDLIKSFEIVQPE